MALTEERMVRAISQACLALRRRHAAEEGAHAPALAALSRALTSQGAELQAKVESMQQEISQCYRAQAQVSEQLVHEVTNSRTLESDLAEKEASIAGLHEQLQSSRTRVDLLETELKGKSDALDAVVHEITSLRSQVDELETQLKKAEADNKMLVDRWMTQKMHDAERLNEANAMYEDMMTRFKAARLEDLAKQQVDGIVRYTEAGAENYVVSRLPTIAKHTVIAHEGGCAALAYENNGCLLFSGGHDCLVKVWDTTAGTIVNTLRGCLGTVIDLAISLDNTLVLGACSDHKLYLWDANTSRIRHTLTGHSEKVIATDFSKTTNRRAISAAHDRTIKSWDLVSGYGLNTIICYSNCNSACLTSDATIICSGHLDGSLRQWDLRSGKLTNEVAAHAQGITSVSLSRSGNSILTTGRDNFHNIFDVRTLEVCARFSAPGYRVATNWSRSCMSADEKSVAAGSIDGAVFLWKCDSNELGNSLKSHTSPVLSCAWSDVGRSLSTSDKAGSICIWE